MASKRQYIDVEEKRAKEQARVIAIKGEIQNYTIKNLIISSLDGAIYSTWSGNDAPVKVIERNRFPQIDGSTPDFLFRFDNGYNLIGEFKSVWKQGAEEEANLAQLAKYRGLIKGDSDAGQTEQCSADLLLIVEAATDEIAVEGIAGYSALGPGSVVVVNATLEARNASMKQYVRFAYYKHGGLNGRFSVPNAGSVDSDHDLNKYFIVNRGFPARCDVDALVESGECPFVNDEPPVTYTIINVLLPVINSCLTENERDEVATEPLVQLPLGESEILAKALELYPRLDSIRCQKWIKNAISQLMKLGVLVPKVQDGKQMLLLCLDDRLHKLEPDQLVNRIAKQEIAALYVPIRSRRDTGQMELVFE